MNEQTKKVIKQLEKIEYNLGRVLEQVSQARAEKHDQTNSYVRGRLTNWVRDCGVCGQEFFPTSNKNIRCGRCR